MYTPRGITGLTRAVVLSSHPGFCGVSSRLGGALDSYVVDGGSEGRNLRPREAHGLAEVVVREEKLVRFDLAKGES